MAWLSMGDNDLPQSKWSYIKREDKLNLSSKEDWSPFYQIIQDFV
jgi:hypothetical protein